VVGCAGNCVAAKDCDDGNPCTVGHTCSAGQCKGPAQVRVTTLAGSLPHYADGPGAAAHFNGLSGLDADGEGGWFIADRNNHRIRRWHANGAVSTVAGGGKTGLVDGPALSATFYQPTDVALDVDGGLWIADSGNHAIRYLGLAGKVALIAGTGLAGADDGVGAQASFSAPVGIAVAVTGAIWVADRDNHRVRRVALNGKVSVVAGGLPGYVDGPVAQARFTKPEAVAAGPDGRLWIADTGNHRIRRVEAHGVVVTVAGAGFAGSLDGPAAKALLAEPVGLAIDSGGTLWISDRLTHRLRRLTAGQVSTPTGWASGFVDGDDAVARFHLPAGLAVDSNGQLAVADRGNHRLRRVSLSAGTCHIDGACRAPGLVASGKGCLRCDAALSAKAWSAQKDGAPCADGAACTAKDTCSKAACQPGPATAGCVY
jgi:sugar lactone lactonase YvrE